MPEHRTPPESGLTARARVPVFKGGVHLTVKAAYAPHLRRFRTTSAARLKAALRALKDAERGEAALAVVRGVGSALAAWAQRLGRALAVRHTYIPAQEREELVQVALTRVWRSALRQPREPFAKAAPPTALRPTGGFSWFADRVAGEWRRGMKRRGLQPWRKRDGEAEPDVPDLADVGDNAPFAFVADAQPRGSFRRDPPATEAPGAVGSRERPWQVRRRSARWAGDLGRWACTAELVAAIRAVAPFWLKVRVDGAERVGGRVGLRTIAALQSPHATTRVAGDALPRVPGVPVADLDDPLLAQVAWERLRPEERAVAEQARQRALGVLEGALVAASLPQMEAWRGAVSAERRLAELEAPTAEAFDAAEAAWLALYGAGAAEGPQRQRNPAGDARGDSVRAAEDVRAQRYMRDLEAALLSVALRRGGAGREVGPHLRWDATELRALLAWCEAWTRHVSIGRGLRYRRPDALRAALCARTAEARAGVVSALGQMAVLAGMADRIRPAHPSIFEAALSDARAVAEGVGGAELVWDAIRAGASAGGVAGGGPPAPDRPAIEIDPVAAVLDADERIAAARWLGIDRTDEVLGALGPLLTGWTDARRARAARALALTHARFPHGGAAQSLVELLRAPCELPPAIATMLGAPVVADPSSVAYADDGDASALEPVGLDGDAADVWVGGGQLALVGPGWEVPGCELVSEDVGTRGEEHRALLRPGAWRVLRHGRVILTLTVRARARR